MWCWCSVACLHLYGPPARIHICAHGWALLFEHSTLLRMILNMRGTRAMSLIVGRVGLPKLEKWAY
ncbi:hypothetical protein BPSOL_0358 [Bifidobacterium pseudolongum]|nr:hypothetical protein BPSOL_0358 [Bifidobacterium pseudolongum]